ncbi:uncharacterized protein LOC113386417 [Ctenocephalides felis]|uniref:uncharacterized protein LOC113386417 n=1 Tax=Ctenocephalides felis TaxID=7515 RepID=UPI000E6E2A2F|nr:uncharacterized protein LOC113386417 [Ctenocephalides felis]
MFADKFGAVLALASILVATTQGQSLDDLINQVFNNNSGPTDKTGGTQIGGGLITAPNNGGGGGGVQPNNNFGQITGGGGGQLDNPNQGGNIDIAGGGGGTCNGECVPYYLCSANNSVITDGVGLIDIRTITPAPPRPGTPQKHPPGCGYRNPEGVGFRIVGDKEGESQFGEFPWMVAVLREEAIDGKAERINVYQCGGSLIHPQDSKHHLSAQSSDQRQNSAETEASTTSTVGSFSHCPSERPKARPTITVTSAQLPIGPTSSEESAKDSPGKTAQPMSETMC